MDEEDISGNSPTGSGEVQGLPLAGPPQQQVSSQLSPIESISSSDDCQIISDESDGADSNDDDSTGHPHRRVGGFIRCCGCQRWTRASDRPSCTGCHCGQCTSTDSETGIVLCFTCAPSKTPDVSFPGVRTLIIIRHSDKSRGILPAPRCEECNDDNQFALPCVWCRKGLCLSCSNWISSDVALCTQCLVVKGEADEPYHKYRGMTIPFFGISEKLHPSITMFFTSTGQAFESLEHYRVRIGHSISASNTALTMAYTIGVFANVFPSAGATSTDDDYVLKHELTAGGDIIKVIRRRSGSVIHSWSVSAVYWIKLMHIFREVGF